MAHVKKKEFIDFNAIKRDVRMEDVLSSYGILGDFKLNKHQYRGCCPLHNGSNKRQFVINTRSDEWYCHGECDEGGDIIQFVASYENMSNYDAAKKLHDGFIDGTPPVKKSKPIKKRKKAEMEPQSEPKTLQPLTYLEPDHSLLIKHGIMSDTADHFDAGYKSKGVGSGRLAIAIYDEDENLLAYCGRALRENQSPKMWYPKNFDPHSVIFNINNITDDIDILHVARDPLDVLLHYEDGEENVVALLGDDISPEQMEMLLDFIKSKKIKSIQF